VFKIKEKIIFTKTYEVSDLYVPVPASVVLPEWYKKTQSYTNNKIKGMDLVSYSNAGTNSTIKKCMPVFDALTSGYIIPTPCDIFVEKNPDGSTSFASSLKEFITFHNTIQAPYHPETSKTNLSQGFPKWKNPWGIETPKGFSCLIINPVHSSNLYFSIFEGIIDTDRYNSPINFPFVLKDTEFEGIIPAGTPLVQVIPFKRQSWKMEMGNAKNLEKIAENQNDISSIFFDRYKKMFWSKKEYL
jgi:hypothetical protein